MLQHVSSVTITFVCATCFSGAVLGCSQSEPTARPPTRVAHSAESPSLIAPPPLAPFKVVTELDTQIFVIFQDRTGSYWFGHGFGPGSGLYRWSGKGQSFDLFTTESGLGDNAVNGIQEDRLGNLYISTATGVSRFDGRAFTTLTLDETEPVRTEVELGPDVLWFKAGGDQPQAIYYDGTALRRLAMPKTPPGDAFEARLPRSKYPRRGCPYDAYTIYKDSRGAVWFGTASLGAWRFDGKRFTWISEVELEFDEEDNRTFGTRSIIEDRDGKFWITVTRNRFDMYPPVGSPATGGTGGIRYTRLPGLPHSAKGVEEDYTFIMSMAKDKAGDLWMVTYGAGVWRYDGKVLTHYPVLIDGKPITLFSIYADRNNGLWVGTHDHGVLRFNGTTFEKARF